jgi:hypothetical protein
MPLVNRCKLMLFIGATYLSITPLFAQSPTPPFSGEVDKEQIAAALQLTQQAAVKYEFILDGADADQPKLLSEPVLRWSNPAAGQVHGNVYLWTSGGRPAVVGSLFKWFSPHTHMSHEFQSLAEQPLIGNFDGKEVWTCREPGLRFAALADAPQPSKGSSQRLLQMRELARSCTVSKLERDGTVAELRLLPQPIYRYESPQNGTIDGGLFAFVQGTDPDLFLLLEARESRGNVAWHFAASRMNSVGLSLRYKGQEIWQADVLPWSDVNGHRLPYTSFRHD